MIEGKITKIGTEIVDGKGKQAGKKILKYAVTINNVEHLGFFEGGQQSVVDKTGKQVQDGDMVQFATKQVSKKPFINNDTLVVMQSGEKKEEVKAPEKPAPEPIPQANDLSQMQRIRVVALENAVNMINKIDGMKAKKEQVTKLADYFVGYILGGKS